MVGSKFRDPSRQFMQKCSYFLLISFWTLPTLIFFLIFNCYSDQTDSSTVSPKLNQISFLGLDSKLVIPQKGRVLSNRSSPVGLCATFFSLQMAGRSAGRNVFTQMSSTFYGSLMMLLKFGFQGVVLLKTGTVLTKLGLTCELRCFCSQSGLQNCWQVIQRTPVAAKLMGTFSPSILMQLSVVVRMEVAMLKLDKNYQAAVRCLNHKN